MLMLFSVAGCEKTDFTPGTESDIFFFLRNKGAEMPVWVQGNTNSKKLLLLLHGGPGGSSFIFDAFFKEFTDPLEENFGVVYWEQRSSGTAQGAFPKEDLTPEQFEEDLDLLITLLQEQFGTDYEIYLAGISWGGYLGSSWLINSGRQQEISGWINIVGPHDFQAIGQIGRDKLAFYADQQISYGNNLKEWEEIRDWCQEHPGTLTEKEFNEVNRYAHQSANLLSDSLIVETSPATFGEELSFAFSSPFHSNSWLSNRNGIATSEMIETLLNRPLDCSPIEIPVLFLGGRFDMVVPTEVLVEQFNAVSSSQKSIHILPHSAHSVISQEVNTVVDLLLEFIDTE
jgi:proline iminopeptidase